MKNKKTYFLFVLFLVLFFYGQRTSVAYAMDSEDFFSDFMGEEELEEIEQIVSENLDEEAFSFSGYVKKLVSGETKLSVSEVWNQIKTGVTQELNANRSLWVQCFVIALMVTFLTNLAEVFENKQVGETGYFIGYLLLLSLLSSTFLQVFAVAENMLELLLTYVKALLPVYFMMTAVSSGSAVASGGYELALLVIALVEFVVGKLVLPVVEIYFVLILLNHLSGEDRLGKLLELMETGIDWVLKGLLGVVTGMNVIQGLLLPAVQRVKQNVVWKTGEAIPVVGDALSGVAETVFSVAVLLRNAIGVAGVVAMILICAMPLLKLFVYQVVFRVEAAFLQPMGDKRICQCLTGISKTAGFLLYLELVSMLLFVLTILILSLTLTAV